MALANPQERPLEFSPFQRRVLSLPESNDLFLGGGRGGGKSWTLALLILRHVEQYGESARILYVRQSYPGMADFELLTRELFGRVYGTEAAYNAQSHTWRFPNGAYLELGHLADHGDLAKYQGRSFTLALVDEAGQVADPALLDLLRSNLRGPKEIPLRFVMAANPGGPGHQWIAGRYVFRCSAPWVPFHEEKSGSDWIYCPSTYTENPFIDQEGYRKQLEAGTATDPELGKAWISGDWTVARGAYFAGVLDESRNCIDAWPTPAESTWWKSPPTARRPKDRNLLGEDFEPSREWENFSKYGGSRDWELFLAYDHGTSKPAACYVVARSPGSEGPDGRYYPRGSLVLVDEFASNEPGSLDKGMGYVVPRLADEIKELAEKWGIEPRGCADDGCFSRHGHGAGSIADEFSRCGVHFDPAQKADRKTGWERMRRMLADAGETDSPGLYVSRSCEYWWATVPGLGRDPKGADDVDTRTADHAADATRYALTFEKSEGLGMRPFQL